MAVAVAVLVVMALVSFLGDDDEGTDVRADGGTTTTTEAADAEKCAPPKEAEGKPEAAWPKIVEGRLNSWYKERVLLDQAFVRDDKQTVAQFADSGGATIVRFAQLFIGG